MRQHCKQGVDAGGEGQGSSGVVIRERGGGVAGHIGCCNTVSKGGGGDLGINRGGEREKGEDK